MQPRLGRQAERACRAVADEEEAVTATIPSKAADILIIVKFGLRRPGFDLHPGRFSDCGLAEDQVHVRLILAQNTAALPPAARKNQIDQSLKISPVELPDHAKANFAHFDLERGRLRMERVRFITNATQQIIGVLDGADRHLIAGGTGEARKSARLTQHEVAKRLHKPQSFIAKYEGGERRIDVVEFVTVCQAIGADPAKLLKALIKAIGGASD
jgi:hypothetical protein